MDKEQQQQPVQRDCIYDDKMDVLSMSQLALFFILVVFSLSRFPSFALLLPTFPPISCARAGLTKQQSNDDDE